MILARPIFFDAGIKIDAFYECMHLLHMFFHLPDLLEFLAAELTSQFFLVNLSLFPVMNVLYMSCYVVAVQKALAANFTRIVSLACV